jgi:hypothetical protein
MGFVCRLYYRPAGGSYGLAGVRERVIQVPVLYNTCGYKRSKIEKEEMTVRAFAPVGVAGQRAPTFKLEQNKKQTIRTTYFPTSMMVMYK